MRWYWPVPVCLPFLAHFSSLLTTRSFPLRPILKKDLTIRSNETGTKADIEACMQLSAAGKVKCEVEVMGILKLNEAMDRVKLGGVLGKLVLDLRVE